MADTYQCAACQGVFEQGWSDTDAAKEAVTLWGVDPTKEPNYYSIICDDCFQRVMKGLGASGEKAGEGK